MKTFAITFHGRKKEAIGIISLCVEKVTAPDILSAVAKLYETHEHVMVVTHTEVVDDSALDNGLTPD
jgi:hypothetical protein